MPNGTDWKRSLQAEFCPPLDSALVAALLADYEHDGELGDDATCSVREQLSLLAASAVEQQAIDLTEDLTNLKLTSQSTTTETCTDRDSIFESTTPDSSSNESASTSGDASASHSSALGFLRASFPNVPTYILKERLQAEHAAGDFNMQHLVEDLLSEEHIRDLEERDLSDEAPSDNPDDWTTVSRNSSRKANTATPKKKASKAKGKTIVVNDVRQQRQSIPRLFTHSAGDPWSQILSISTYLSNVLPRPQTFFSSYFHKPDYSEPSSALRAALSSIKQQEAQDEDHQATLEALIDFIADSPEYRFEYLTPAEKSQLSDDAELCLEAAGGSPEAALDVFKLLRELDEDSSGSMGLYHTPAVSLRTKASPSTPSRAKDYHTLTISPVAPKHPSRESSPLRSPARAPTATAPTNNTWEDVPVRPKAPHIHPLAEHIPAYNSANVPRKKSKRPPISANPSSTVPSSGYRSAGVLGGYRSQIEEARNKHDEMLRTASRHWNTGSGRNRGGEVALYYALEAQKLQAEARSLQLDAMRAHVNSKRQTSTQSDTIDVHYCTTLEALTIVREVLGEGGVVQGRHLHIVTGRGLHSSGGVPVLAPAIKIALERDGWAVGSWSGGLSVRGRS